MSDKINRRCIYILLGASLLGALFVLFAVSAEVAELIINKAGYYFTAVAVGWFLYLAVKTVRLKLPQRSHLIYLICGVVLSSTLMCLHEEFAPKVAWDDYILSSTAKSLAYEREVEALTMGRNFNGYFIRIEDYVDKRPWLYPFATSVLHDLTGYRFENGLLVNVFFGITLLSLTAILGYSIGGLPAGLFGPLLWASLPLAGQNAMGGGLDMLNVLLLLVVFMSSLYYVQRPCASRLSLLSLATVLLCYARYESIIFWIPVLLVVVIGWYRLGRPVLSYGFAAAPALLIGLVALQYHIESNTELWELRNEVASRFGAEYLIPNLYSALHYLWNFGDEHSNSLLLGLVGIPCLILLLLRAAQSLRVKDHNCYSNAVYMIFSIGILGHFLLIMFYFDGQFDEKVSSRFALPLYLLLVVSILAVLSDSLKRPRHWWLAAVVLSVFMFGFTLPNKAKGIYSKRNYVVREAEWLLQQAEQNFKPMCLVVDPATVFWSLNEWQCMSVVKAVSNLERLQAERKRGKFPEIYLVDRLSATYDEEKRVRFESNYKYFGFEKILIAERSFLPLGMTRIYKVVAIKPDERPEGIRAPTSGDTKPLGDKWAIDGLPGDSIPGTQPKDTK